MLVTAGLRLALAHAAAALALAGIAACSSGPSAGSATCPGAGSITCPAVPPTYTADVEPIIQGHCYGCHGPRGIEQGSFDLTTYANVANAKSDIEAQVGQCIMPPPDAGQLTSRERTTLFEWLECQTPR